MSNINNIIQINHADTGMVFSLSTTRAATDPGFSVGSILVAAVDETVNISEFDNPRQVALRLMSGDDVRVGLDYGTDGLNYPFRLSGANDFMILRLDVEGLVETQTVTTVADVADSLDGTYFVVTDSNAETWAIGVGTLTHSEDNEISTALLTDGTAAEVAAAIYAALIADAAFIALFDVAYDATADDDLITITDKKVGTRVNIADTGTTGFTLSTIQQGAASPAIHLLSLGTSQAMVAVIPN